METISGRRIVGFIGLALAIVVVVLAVGSLLSGGTPAATVAPGSPAGSPSVSSVPPGSPVGPTVVPAASAPAPSASAPSAPAASAVTTSRPGASAGEGPQASIEIPPPID